MEYSFCRFLEEKASVKAEEAAEIMKLIESREVKKGEVILRAGVTNRYIYFVEKGLLRFYSIDKEGKEHIVQFAAESWFVGDRGGFFFGEPSPYFIDAIEDSRVALLDQDFTEKASNISRAFRNYNEYLLQNHVRSLQRRINLLVSATVEERYLDFMATYPDLINRVAQWMIASYLGVTPEGLSRVRRNLVKKKFKP